MSAESNEQYRAGFEAWARKVCKMPAGRPINWDSDWTKESWKIWVAAKSEASTEPSAWMCPKCGVDRLVAPCGNLQDCGMIATAYAGPETPAGSAETRMDAGFEGGPRVGAAGALTDDAKDAKDAALRDAREIVRLVANGLGCAESTAADASRVLRKIDAAIEAHKAGSDHGQG